MADRGGTEAADSGVPVPSSGTGGRLWPAVAAVAAGGMLGALARHAVLVALPQAPATVDWATFLVNVTGCALIGVLMEVITRRPGTHPLLRPFLGVGVLGGYTTFSASVTDATAALTAGHPRVALLSLAANLAGALVAVWAASTATAALLDRVAARGGTS
ncbi:fluoride efflux transporter FluC [Thermobifida halotolerans]|uniref:fluoride efflux transporter FluC n=1 Tax=Thermobifida halotolerans TaxID=483545 RepID=UPI0008386D38